LLLPLLTVASSMYSSYIGQPQLLELERFVAESYMNPLRARRRARHGNPSVLGGIDDGW
jgi:hypothetical protein